MYSEWEFIGDNTQSDNNIVACATDVSIGLFSRIDKTQNVYIPLACQAPDTENQDLRCIRAVTGSEVFIMSNEHPIGSLDAVEYRYGAPISLR